MESSSRLIEDFVNTLHKDPRGDEEQLSSPETLAEWLRRHELGEVERATRGELARAIALRESLRQLLLRNNGIEVDSDMACDVLSDTSRRAKLGLRFKDALPTLVPEAGGVDGALGRIVAAMQEMVADGSWQRLKACRARDCEWAFFDTAKNQSRAWCSMRSCGNREKARAFRQRHAAETSGRATA